MNWIKYLFSPQVMFQWASLLQSTKGTPKKLRQVRTLDQKIHLVSAGRCSRKALRGFNTPVEVKENRKGLYLH